MKRVGTLILILVAIAATAWAADVYSLVKSGNQAFRDGKLDEALTQYQEAEKIEPNRSEIQINIGNALLQKGKADEAIKAYNKALTSPDSHVVERSLYNRGAAQIAKQDFAGAIDSYRRALRIDPSDEDAKHNLLWAMKKKQEQQEQKDQQDKQDKQDQQNQQQNEQEQQEDKSQEENKDENSPEDQKDQKSEQEQTPEPQQPEQKPADQAEQNQDEQEQQAQPLQPGDIDPETAAAILDALQNEEQQELQMQMQKGQSDEDVDKDW